MPRRDLLSATTTTQETGLEGLQRAHEKRLQTEQESTQSTMKQRGCSKPVTQRRVHDWSSTTHTLCHPDPRSPSQDPHRFPIPQHPICTSGPSATRAANTAIRQGLKLLPGSSYLNTSSCTRAPSTNSEQRPSSTNRARQQRRVVITPTAPPTPHTAIAPTARPALPSAVLPSSSLG